MKKNRLKIHCFNFIITLLVSVVCLGQNAISLKADFDIENREITISQTIQYKNTTQNALKTIYLNDWNNSYAAKTTDLAKRIADEYKTVFHLAKDKERGYSTISDIKQNGTNLKFERLSNKIDVIKVELVSALQPNDSYTIQLNYTVKLPSNKFTGYGLTDSGDLNLKYWYITPAVYDGKWHCYSNKNLDDLYIPSADLNFEITYPNGYALTSELNLSETYQSAKKQTVELTGKNRVNTKLFLNKNSPFKTIQTKDFAIVSDIEENDLDVLDKVLITEKITIFIIDNFGEYPHKKLLLTQTDADKDPIYGLNFLPKFIRAYPDNFNYELKLLKVALRNYLENTLLVNPRTEQWLLDGIQIYYLINYVDQYYPNMKFLGAMADIWGVKSFHISDMKFNDKYNHGFMVMARTNKDQPLGMAKDSLLKFNYNIASKYKAGIGLKYLDNFVNHDIVETALDSFMLQNKLKPVTAKDFETYIKSKTDKDIDWFFSDYVNTRKGIDFKIKKVSKTTDSITVTIKNKEPNSMPVSLYTLRNDTVISKIWVEHIKKSKTLTLPRNGGDKLALNYDNAMPETNQRDNWKSLKGFFSNNKPLQFRVFKDIEDPNYSQVFFMPILEFNNIYDGITLGARMYNTTLLRKLFNYKIEPMYAFGSKSLTGSAAVSKIHYLKNSDLYYINYGIVGSYTSYADNLFARSISPSLTLMFREKEDFRSNKRKAVVLRYVDINRDKDINNVLTSNEPNYGVFNARFTHSNDNLINYNRWYTDFQASKTFSKVAFNYEFRKLYENNRQLNLRFFTGAFINNKNDVSSNYFSFALDRPTDYLFEYPYLGRSEATGIFSQQYIDAEGGFKSKLSTPFANQWLSTVNVSTTLWNYILLYGDMGVVKNKNNYANYVFDSGIRVNLVTDYFELYFPVYSNLGWEIGQPHYDQKIRFKVTIDPQMLLGLFRRRWY